MDRRRVALLFLLTLGFQQVAALGFCAKSDVSFDLHTQYPAPWGGQGWNMVSDAFPPGAVVELSADYSFEGDGVSGKPVTYMLRAPDGEIFSGVAITQEDGTSVIAFVLPSSEPYFGLWTIQASVEEAGGRISDTLWFLMGWLVEVVNVDVPELALKGNPMEVNATIARICLQDPMDIMRILFKDSNGEPLTDSELLLCISVTDAVGQFVAASESKTPMASGLRMYDLEEFVSAIGSGWAYYSGVILQEFPALVNTAANTVTIPIWSFTGMATVHASLITDRLMVACCSESLGNVWIKKNPLTDETSITPTSADINNDGKVDINDLNVVAAAFGSHASDIPQLGDACSDKWNPMADLNGDGWVDVSDIIIVAMEYE
jgi:hypothetical protein